ncbi:hypothetical protein ACFXKC_11495 [Streptomyces sp. NPDC059340]|uniref:hypothetical protein n=1 Tax=Streptomyces sp. NPDC059340 TaxID=3346806 RepID=UPI0036CD8709
MAVNGTAADPDAVATPAGRPLSRPHTFRLFKQSSAATHPFLLTPAVTLNRWWRAWTDTDPPSELLALIDAVTTGHGIDLYRRF